MKTIPVVRALVTNLKDTVELTSFEEEVIKLASQPTATVQFSVINGIIKAHGAVLDSETEKFIKQVVSPTSFKVDLTKAGYIKDEGEEGLKGLLG